MILLIGSPKEPMVSGVHEELLRRGRPVILIAPTDLPGTVRLTCTPDGRGWFRLPDGSRVEHAGLSAIYQRVGFGDFEAYADYGDDEARFVGSECMGALAPLLDHHPGLVVNRPSASGTNASKPYQVSLVQRLGFRVPETLVTNQPEAVLAFYERFDGNVIYKSISYVRSIVQTMQPEDLERLDSLQLGPVQVQERVEGTDLRVHVVGDRVFASWIEATEADYRYDREATITPHELPGEVEERCLALSRELDLPLAGIDLRLTPHGEYCCFEVNPSPAFTWYEQHTGQPLTEAVADLLEQGAG